MLPWAVRGRLGLERLPPEQLAALQWRKLERLLRAAYNGSPFYQRRFKEIGACPEDFRCLDDLACFPELTREELHAHIEEILISAPERLRVDRSGGSTGQPLTVYFDRGYKYRRLVLRERLYSWAGAAGLYPRCFFWGAAIAPNIQGPVRHWQRWVKSSFRYRLAELTVNDMACMARDLKSIRPAVVTGYASILLALARYMQENGLSNPHPPRMVISTAEPLYQEDRLMIERGLQAPVYNQYGLTETFYFAGECQARQGLHVLMDHVHLEILAGGKPAAPGEHGYLIATDLDNLAMPLIRYRTNDIAAWSVRTCSCGRGLPMLENVYGRDGDFLFDQDGAVCSGTELKSRLNQCVESEAIHQFQFGQTVKGQVKVLAIPKVVPAPELAEKIRRCLADLFHGRMVVELAWVEGILREPSSKMRLIKSTVPWGGDGKITTNIRHVLSDDKVGITF
jgi:phenylacetate-CoA ligase